MDFEKILESVANFTKDQKAQLLELLGAKIDAEDSEVMKLAEKKLNEKDQQIVQLSEKIKTIESNLEKKEKEISFNLMLSEGNVVEAQREAFMKGDINEFAKNAVKINLSETGSSEPSDFGDGEKARLKLSELTDVYMKENKVSYLEAAKAVASKNAELVKKAIN